MFAWTNQFVNAFPVKQKYYTLNLLGLLIVYFSSTVTILFFCDVFLQRDVGIAKASCPSVCNVEVSCSYRLEFLEINFTAISLTFPLSADTNVTDLLQKKHPQILAAIGVR